MKRKLEEEALTEYSSKPEVSSDQEGTTAAHCEIPGQTYNSEQSTDVKKDEEDHPAFIMINETDNSNNGGQEEKKPNVRKPPRRRPLTTNFALTFPDVFQ